MSEIYFEGASSFQMFSIGSSPDGHVKYISQTQFKRMQHKSLKGFVPPERSDLMFSSRSTVLTCHRGKMVEAAPDPVYTHRRVELGASEQRGGNRFRSGRFQQLWAFSQDAVAPNKHLPFI